jgi:hypothetical protein
MEMLIILALTASVVVALSIWEGFVLTKLWMWFVVPTFGLPMLTIPVAIGLALIVGFLTHQMRQTNRDEEPLVQAASLFGHGFFNAGVILFMGWVVHSFFM